MGLVGTRREGFGGLAIGAGADWVGSIREIVGEAKSREFLVAVDEGVGARRRIWEMWIRLSVSLARRAGKTGT